MTMGRNIHVMPSGNRWAVRLTGAKRASAIFTDEKSAWLEARTRADRGRAIAYLHDAGGRIVAWYAPAGAAE